MSVDVDDVAASAEPPAPGRPRRRPGATTVLWVAVVATPAVVGAGAVLLDRPAAVAIAAAMTLLLAVVVYRAVRQATR